MRCRWVTDSRLTTFGRRVVITSAVFGLTTVGGAAGAFAASDTVGFSPAAKVVKIAPMAVSVTFREPLRSGGAQLRVLSAVGEVGTGKVTTGQKTLRRSLRLGAPAGEYTVEWKAVSAKGQKMTGSFTFFAARSNDEAASEPGSVSPGSAVPGSASPGSDPAAAGEPVPGPMVTAEVGSTGPNPTAEVITPPSSGATPSSGSIPASTITVEPTATPGGSETPDWMSGSDPIWTPNPLATATATATTDTLSAGRSGGRSDGGTDGSVSTGFTAIPLAVGGLLVLAAGMVSLVNRPRLRG